MTEKEKSQLSNYYQSTDPRDWKLDLTEATKLAEGMLHFNAGMAWYVVLLLYAHKQDEAMRVVGQHIDRNASMPTGVIDGFKTLGVEGAEAIRDLVRPRAALFHPDDDFPI